MLGGPLDNKTAARLLLSAAALDAVLVLMLSKIIILRILKAFSELPNELIYVGTFMALLVIYWLIAEFVMGGRTVGRLVLNLRLLGANGSPLSAHKKAVRAFLKLSTLGVTGLRLDGPAHYDRLTGAMWYSPMAPKALRPVKDWKLVVVNGSRKGLALKFGSLDTFRQSGSIRIGRDQGWSDLRLTNDSKISGRHCVLKVRSNEVYLRDGGSGDKGSTNGTTLLGEKLTPNNWTQMGNTDHFYAADIKIKLIR